MSFVSSRPTAWPCCQSKVYMFAHVSELSPIPTVFPTHASGTPSPPSPRQPAPATRSSLHIYDIVRGFSASLIASCAEELRRHPAVLAAFEDQVRQLHTTRSPQFMGLRAHLGLWSLSDRNLPPVPTRWRGDCDAGPVFPASSCNRKLVGAPFFS
ncbi:hypothetical protein QYE76_020997 [Lolium multiflorum]|uniref:Inhibitor I9 domain-containing protein n=1 Tax=Lolium multiflorum TaxID=4521 RepID=A0AAD8R5W9_LOLMU|nr:hypothetical protein QYE76_020997 [Lolium multiflorum]